MAKVETHVRTGNTCTCGKWEPVLGTQLTTSFDQHLKEVGQGLVACANPQCRVETYRDREGFALPRCPSCYGTA